MDMVMVMDTDNDSDTERDMVVNDSDLGYRYEV
jgi:hypothetical protein